MKLQPVIARIRTEVATFSNRVGGTAEIPIVQAEFDALPVPHAFVMMLADDAGEPLSTTATVQRLTESFAVLVAVSNTTDRRGQSASDAMEDIRDALIAALVGWSPDADLYDDIAYDGGQFRDMTRARLWHQYDFFTVRTLYQT